MLWRQPNWSRSQFGIRLNERVGMGQHWSAGSSWRMAVERWKIDFVGMVGNDSVGGCRCWCNRNFDLQNKKSEKEIIIF